MKTTHLQGFLLAIGYRITSTSPGRSPINVSFDSSRADSSECRFNRVS
ncbi:hypothetical protein [Laspinema olomoucense]|uniref:Uncharacterized protein n=1 Tax=Laspinema olomoucense D3b TaxID=2953688 RepID=A0ABT2NIH6_9CYAN|nr:hypothetical protein [Laspinema sp. D3b]MCT7981096.1 hypothetical protein [Laspinema sp. D3b]